MRLLIVSYWFPPRNMIGAVRVGKFAAFMERQGHDVRVLAAKPVGDHSLPLEIAAEHVVYARELDFEGMLSHVGRRRLGGARSTGQGSDRSGVPETGSLRERIRRHYYGLIHLPDPRNGWLPHAVAAGTRLIADWQPDLVYASAPPVTGLLIGKKLSRRAGAVFVAELRDLWTDNPYYPFPLWRRALDHRLEARVLRRASALVSVSPGWARQLSRRHEKPAISILNGYVPEDLHGIAVPPSRPGPLRVVYTGHVYRRYRDPSPLFQAVALLGEMRNEVTVEFYGTADEDILPLAAAFGVEDRVVVADRVPYQASLALQKGADVLLLLQWDHQSDAGNIPAKFFEYVGARRPILFIGYQSGTLAELIREREAGFGSNEPQAISERLAAWIRQRRRGTLPPPPESALSGLSRDEQFERLDTYLRRLLPPAPAPNS